MAPKPLIAALRDSDSGVRLEAAWALSQISNAEAIPAVTAALRVEPQDHIRQARIRALLESGEASTDALQNLLASKDGATRARTVRALAARRSPWLWPWPQPRPGPFP